VIPACASGTKSVPTRLLEVLSNMSKLRFVLLALFALAIRVPLSATETCSASAANGPAGTLPMCLALDQVTTTGASATVDTFSHRLLRAQVWSAAGSVATVTVDMRSNPSAPWFTVVTITNPSASGEYWSVPRGYQMRVNVSAWTSGTISATIERYKN
jgi:hypothetical protein